jgi:hypothetical protein
VPIESRASPCTASITSSSLRGIDAEDDDAIEHFDQLMGGALAID